MIGVNRCGRSLMAKIAIIFSIPLIFEIAVISISINLLGSLERERVERQKLADVVFCASRLISLIMSEALSKLQSIDRGQEVRTEALDRHPESFHDSWLACLAAARRAKLDATEIESQFLAFRKSFTAISTPPSGSFTLSDIEKRSSASIAFTGLMDVIERTITGRLAEMKDKEVLEARLQERMKLVILIALVASVALSILLSYIIGKVTVARLDIIEENVKRFSQEKELLPRLTGHDEISSVDTNFRIMAATLTDLAKRDRAYLDNATDVICALDEELRFDRLSASSATLWGRKPEELVKKELVDLIAPDHLVSSLEQFERARTTGAHVVFENMTVDVAGNSIPCLWSVTWSAEDSIYICVVRDTTERKEAESLRQELMTMVSHDLRTPLTTAQLALEVMLSGLEERREAFFDDDLAKLVEIDSSIGYVIGLINDLLDLLKLKEGKLEFEPVLTSVTNLRSIVEEYLQDRKIDCQLRLDCPGQPLVLIDRDFIPRIVYSIVRHAQIAYRGRPTEIAIDHHEGTGSINLRVEPSDFVDDGAKVGSDIYSETTKRISREISLELSESVAHEIEGDFEISWDPSGYPLYCLRFPCVQFQ